MGAQTIVATRSITLTKSLATKARTSAEPDILSKPGYVAAMQRRCNLMSRSEYADTPSDLPCVHPSSSAWSSPALAAKLSKSFARAAAHERTSAAPSSRLGSPLSRASNSASKSRGVKVPHLLSTLSTARMKSMSSSSDFPEHTGMLSNNNLLSCFIRSSNPEVSVSQCSRSASISDRVDPSSELPSLNARERCPSPRRTSRPPKHVAGETGLDPLSLLGRGPGIWAPGATGENPFAPSEPSAGRIPSSENCTSSFTMFWLFQYENKPFASSKNLTRSTLSRSPIAGTSRNNNQVSNEGSMSNSSEDNDDPTQVIAFGEGEFTYIINWNDMPRKSVRALEKAKEQNKVGDDEDINDIKLALAAKNKSVVRRFGVAMQEELNGVVHGNGLHTFKRR
ncbi:Chromosome alignment-maintaining phosphoprotein 1 [Frankliniella fusca]|uniref:Chromosome alignment-maintaining phosphoprotein 1 n=1 Tax=Frankliniella fusca TaxID=407009 RepID=A0AAE1LKZ1_9NEOP|nr:Chromosome alignment-maintaining phosphoprotein 1 [Frankliniella fusca]